jgi:hypothetical protein
MSWSSRTDDPLPPGHPEQPGPKVTNQLVTSLVRAWVPVAAGAFITWSAIRWGMLTPRRFDLGAAVWIAAGVTATYQYVAQWLERRRCDGRVSKAACWLGRWMFGGIAAVPHQHRR